MSLGSANLGHQLERLKKACEKQETPCSGRNQDLDCQFVGILVCQFGQVEWFELSDFDLRVIWFQASDPLRVSDSA